MQEQKCTMVVAVDDAAAAAAAAVQPRIVAMQWERIASERRDCYHTQGQWYAGKDPTAMSVQS